VSITIDGRRFDTKEEALAFLAEIERGSLPPPLTSEVKPVANR
jgi:hypothetical protein